jgi:Fe2+ transport system protein FeoA
MKTLNQLPLKKSARILSIKENAQNRLHFMEMGLTKNSIITSEHFMPFGGPKVFQLRGTQVALRSSDAAFIVIEEIE